MTPRARLLATAVIAALLAAGSTGGAATGAHDPDCGNGGVVCREVSVPLDWSGGVSGRISLHVEVNQVSEGGRRVMFLLAGGPGQASAAVFDLRSGGFFRSLFPGYTLVAFDPRGTGDSDPIFCHVTSFSLSRAPAAIAGCAAQLGPRRAFYGTGANAQDLDAVRKALGFDRIGVFGVSYGTAVALTYARMFPSHVSRLLLDSVATEVTALPVVDEVLRRIPTTLDRYCAGRCSGVTENFGRDVVALANELETEPLRGSVLQASGGRRLEVLDASQFIGLVIESDLDPGLAAELPAAVRAARAGNPTPLLRLAALVDPDHVSGELGAVYVATSCDDGPFPWQPGTPLPERLALLESALGSASPASLGGFGTWAVQVGTASMCVRWPDTTVAAPAPAGRYPDVPVLALSGALDLRSPTVEARQALGHFPHGTLIEVTNVGHSTLTSSSSECVSVAIHLWLVARAVPRRCDNPRPFAPLARFPSAAPGAPGSGELSPATTVSLVGRTLRDAEAMLLLGEHENAEDRAPGLVSGSVKIRGSGYGFALSNYGLVAGIRLSGVIHDTFSPGPLEFGGVVRVSDRAGQIGTLAVNGDSLDGTIDGRRVVAGRVASPLPRPSIRPAAWSAWAPPPGSPSSVAHAIALHVGAEYRLSAGGPALDAVRSGRPVASLFGSTREISQIVTRSGFAGVRTFHVATDAWTYGLCGSSGSCGIPGRATAERGRLVRREALELALTTFTFIPGVNTIAVYLPPPPGVSRSISLLLFERSELAAALARPLARTLTLRAPPLPTDDDHAERHTIDRLTLPGFYDFSFYELADGSPELFLTALPA